MEELRPQPIIRKRQKSFVPDEAKVRLIKSHLNIFSREYLSRRIIFFLKAVLRIHLILMRIRIRDPHWKKMDPGIFILKFEEPFRNEEIFIIYCSKVQSWVLGLYPLDPDLWIRIFLRIHGS